jgi:hypothetical protein
MPKTRRNFGFSQKAVTASINTQASRAASLLPESPATIFTPRR